MTQPDAYTVAEAARVAGLTEATLRHAIARGRLPVTRDRRSGRVYVTAADLNAYRRGL